jgi:hypothetical protein
MKDPENLLLKKAKISIEAVPIIKAPKNPV